MKSASEALEIILSGVPEPKSELVPLQEANGRCLAEEIRADRDYPPFHRATMDGFAVRSENLEKGKEYTFENEMTAGMDPNRFLGSSILKIATGSAVPEGFDAVIKIEDCEVSDKKVLFKELPNKPFLNIALRGEDIKSGATAVSSGKALSVSEISLLATLGKKEIVTHSRPKIVILSTGNEVVSIDEVPLPHQIRDSNTYTIASLLTSLGIRPKSVSLLPDDPETIERCVREGLDSDILVLSGGVSMGSLDLIPSILEKCGVKNRFHKIKIKPGKPFWFGTKEKTAVFALPGNPFSVQVCAKIFLEPYILRFQGLQPKRPLKLPFFGTRKKKKDLTEYFPVLLSERGQTGLETKKFNGSGDILAGVFSDGIAVHPSDRPELEDSDIIEFFPW